MKSATSNTSKRDSFAENGATPTLELRASRFGFAWAGALCVQLAELLVVLAVERKRLTSIWELQVGIVGLLPAWILLALPAALLGSTLGSFMVAPSAPTRIERVRGALLVAACAGAVGWGVGGGRHLSTIPVRASFAVVVAALALVSTYGSIAHVRSFVQGRFIAAVVVSALLAIFGIELANHLILVRLYPAFHLGLSLAALVLGAVLGCIARERIVERLQLNNGGTARIYGLFPLLLLASTGLLIVPASRAVSGFDNFRFLVSEGAPTLGWGVQLASRIAPPPELDETVAAQPLGEVRTRPKSTLSFRNRSVLLISIDALRADHLGSYGYDRATTPAMDLLAQQGVRFDAAYAPTPHTSYSITSLMTGKYMRPLLLQGAGQDSELWAGLLRTYGYRTAAFYPPAIFFIDTQRFEVFRQAKLGFEYAKVEFAEGAKRIGQVRTYLEGQSIDERPVFLWVHLFGPHEPYVKAPGHDFGDRDIDRYDSEIRAADQTVGELIALMRKRDPNSVILLTADHGEEFGDHGGRYHGSTVYDEQVRVPLIVSAPGVEAGRVVGHPVQTIDLLPTLLDGLQIVIPPRIRGRSLLPDLAGPRDEGPGLALSETDDYALLARGEERLICQRKSGACQLFDVREDPHQQVDLSGERPQRTQQLKLELRQLAERHGRYESQGLRDGDRAWPKPIVLGLSGNSDVAPELARLLDDADVAVRRKAARLLFDLAQPGQGAALRLALSREEDETARAWIALSVTRLGEGAPLVTELLRSPDVELRRHAALALAEQGNDRGKSELIAWFKDLEHRTQQDALAILNALSEIRTEQAIHPLVQQLDDVRLRPSIARTLAAIGDRDARGPLTAALLRERFQSARDPLFEALLELGARDELIVPLRRFLAVPDPIPHGLDLAIRAGILDEVGGPSAKDVRRLKELSDSGVQLSVIVPGRSSKDPEEENLGVRLLLRARTSSNRPGQIYVQPGAIRWGKGPTFRKRPEIQGEQALTIPWPASELGEDGLSAYRQLQVDLPAEFGAKPGHALSLELYASTGIEVDALAVVPLRKDLPPPDPKPWSPEKSHDEEELPQVDELSGKPDR